MDAPQTPRKPKLRTLDFKDIANYRRALGENQHEVVGGFVADAGVTCGVAITKRQFHVFISPSISPGSTRWPLTNASAATRLRSAS